MDAHFTAIERLFDQMLNAARPILSDAELAEVRHFIEKRSRPAHQVGCVLVLSGQDFYQAKPRTLGLDHQ